jgi:hypothetical protein
LGHDKWLKQKQMRQERYMEIIDSRTQDDLIGFITGHSRQAGMPLTA